MKRDCPTIQELLAFDAVARGPRSVQWRADAPATLVWVEAQDGGDRQENDDREVFQKKCVHSSCLARRGRGRIRGFLDPTSPGFKPMSAKVFC